MKSTRCFKGSIDIQYVQRERKEKGQGFWDGQRETRQEQMNMFSF